MSEYETFMEEKNKIDSYFDRGYQVISIFENLSGTFVDFVTGEGASEREVVQLQLLTAEARNYIAAKLLFVN
ncbi:hypothetical protein [Ureibacillus aquaedulcis]|uniref:Uncharacterized protein n=1 Tax=Ureibacillus aquaedulcis TaxID=3058421 RepID=A0ABT8GT91_9BACL|nr:hypothetical protein [Ureibacillus sp. BA0131]MDN4494618.1 hypothetical protein [Ureibacillus sp. BA0131]